MKYARSWSSSRSSRSFASCGRFDAHRGELVADAAANRVQHDPDPAPLVDAHFDEVVARTERAELLRDLPRRSTATRSPARASPATIRVPGNLAVTLTDAGLDCRPMRTSNGSSESGSWSSVTSSSAATIRTRCPPRRPRDHGVLGRDHRTDGRTETDVRIGHESDMTSDDRQAGGLLGLADRLRVDLAGPGDELVVDAGGHVTPSLSSCVECCVWPTGLEPASSVWRTEILAVERRPLEHSLT